MQTRIEIPEFQSAWERIKECHASVRADTGPIHLRLLGQSGLGKTFLLKQYRNEYPPSRDSAGARVPVALLTIPAAPTVKGIYIAFLESLGLHGAYGTVEALRHRAKVLCKACRVELFLVDELNHLTDRGLIRTREAVSDALKEILENMGRPTVFAGASRSRAIFESNMQLRSRVMSSVTLRPFNLESRFRDLRGFIYALAHAKLGDEIAKQLSSHDVAMRIFFATDGVHRGITRFITLVCMLHTSEQSEIQLDFLAHVFAKYFWEEVPPELNPFGSAFPMRRLSQPSEPFSPTALDGDNHVDDFTPFHARSCL